MRFTLLETDDRARAGVLETSHGVIDTPLFMPVGTQGSVKAIEQRELLEIGAQIILGNTYHLYLRPGTEIIAKAGGLHRFMNWEKPILTDSGGYQVFSLTDLRRIEEEGVTFRSHLDGSQHTFTPEKVVQIQRILGSDLIMVLDECTPFPCEEAYARKSNELTIRWAERCRNEFEASAPHYDHSQALFGIVQGSVYPNIREKSARSLVSMDFHGYAIGGLAVGEPVETMYRMVDVVEPMLPIDKPRYLMGVGTPENLLKAISRGMDMFDCVMPTRNGRNAMLFTRFGPVNIKNAVYKDDFTPVDESCSCYTCRTFTRAYLRHLFQAKEILALQLATIHNLNFYLWLMREARQAILEHRFSQWKEEMLHQMRSDQLITQQ
ncbi:MAG TPA: tRNA guanosine(34) transglycosylase Tgt [Bacteroidota bacterium]|nr:tRNA guanosine(34) transglycosylase Tgt [Bacteroidota bacterium]